MGSEHSSSRKLSLLIEILSYTQGPFGSSLPHKPLFCFLFMMYVTLITICTTAWQLEVTFVVAKGHILLNTKQMQNLERTDHPFHCPPTQSHISENILQNIVKR